MFDEQEYSTNKNVRRTRILSLTGKMIGGGKILTKFYHAENG